jgi:hypothetical protein
MIEFSHPVFIQGAADQIKQLFYTLHLHSLFWQVSNLTKIVKNVYLGSGKALIDLSCLLLPVSNR